MMKTPASITLAHLEVIVMPNGEILCLGRTIGWVKELGRFLTAVDLTTVRLQEAETKRTK